MSVVLHVDTARWRAQQTTTMRQSPGLVPVVKGNGYGFGRDVLLAECRRLGEPDGAECSTDLVAVGTYHEANEALAVFPGGVLVLEPYRHPLHGRAPDVLDPRIVHTVADPDDVERIRRRHPAARVVLEGRTSMGRHGMSMPKLQGLLAQGVVVDGVTLHLPLGQGHAAEVRSWLDALPGVRQVFLSHVSPGELAELRRDYPDRSLRPRVGTALWLGDPHAAQLRADVLDVHRVVGTQRFGYRQHRVRGGHVLVVSGGTAHGVALQAPPAASTWRQRGIHVAEAALAAAARSRSPFTVGGRLAWFVEPPHMQVSLLHLPAGITPPAMGDTVPVRVRHTIAHPDEVVLT